MAFFNIKYAGLCCLLGVCAIFSLKSMAMYDGVQWVPILKTRNNDTRCVEFFIPPVENGRDSRLLCRVPFSLFDQYRDDMDSFFDAHPNFVDILNKGIRYLLTAPCEDIAYDAVDESIKLSQKILNAQKNEK